MSKINKLIVSLFFISNQAYCIDIINNYQFSENEYTLDLNSMTNKNQKNFLKTDIIENSIFQNAIKNAVKELENSISNTCAKKMIVSLNVETSGNWKIVGVGLRGAFEIEIMNPKFPSNCAKN